MAGVAVVTGANKGIGFHIAKQLIESGKFGKVVVACRNRVRTLQRTLSITTTLPAPNLASSTPNPASTTRANVV
jgi:NAD(P)-dependent dehydrogenase (short-subunit alcohol dehydrogenase family)